MPLVTLESNKVITHDVNSVFAEVYGGSEWKSPVPKAFREFRVTFGGALPDGLVKQEVTDKYLMRGVKNPTKGYFETPPVYRVTYEDLDRTQQLRVLTYIEGIWELATPPFAREVAKNLHNLVYEPSIADIQRARAKTQQDLTMPTFALDVLFGAGYLTKAKKMDKLPGVPIIEEGDTMCTDELELIMCELYLERKKAASESYEKYIKTFDEVEVKLADKLGLAELERSALRYAKAIVGNVKEETAPASTKSKSTATLNIEEI